jgi:rod shape-determining protein MreC
VGFGIFGFSVIGFGGIVNASPTGRLGLLFVALMFLSLVSTRFMPNPPQAISSSIAPLTTVIHDTALNLRRAIESVALERDLAVQNQKLTMRVGELESENAKLTAEVGRLERAAQIRRSQSPRLVAIAPVIRVDASATASSVVIGRGRRDGLTVKMPVTTLEGLVGEITDVSDPGGKTAVVRTLVDPKFSISVTIAGKRGRALAQGIGGGSLRARGFNEGLPIKPGDTVMSLNPPGGAFQTARVGRVRQVLPPTGDSIGQIVLIEPSVDLATLEEVVVLGSP